MSAPMRKNYEPHAVESAWYEWWLKKEFFKADNQSTKEKFVMVIPPPNVTGTLHLGHALTNSIQDSITRWHRMNGRNALWVPGTDHAGIATQSVIEKKLWKTGQTRHDLGRAKFLEKAWEWKDQYAARITGQLKSIGSSLDWSRECFTMDEKLSKAVTEAFVRMFNDGIIYRDVRLVNWCCQLNTAISDIEVDKVDLDKRTLIAVPGYDKKYEFGAIWDFAYKVEGSDEEIVVSTTRPETMLGDTAVAVHPTDERYQHLIGKNLIHPFVDRVFPIIADGELVDKAFGTGAVKVTPAHDPNDFKCGKRNGLAMISIFTDNGVLNENCGKFSGMKRFDAREAVVEALKEKNLFRGTRDNPMVLGLCSRSKDVIEPILKPQWWVDCKDMAKRAIQVVENKEMEILPPHHEATWYRWLTDIQDWCISRQLWWGHQIPAYLVYPRGSQRPTGATNSDWVVGRTPEEATAAARAKFPQVPEADLVLERDGDVLDTWFSSGLFPFSVFGWPDNTADLEKFYPGSLLETGQDIIFFWVARMVMLGLQLTDKVPFKQVFLHAMVRDAHGKKMSKSLGNVIDPMDMIRGITLEDLHKQLHEGNLDPKEVERATLAQKEDFPKGIPECGTDAMRFALCAYTSQGASINLDVQRVAAYRNFCNKLWNAVKLSNMVMGDKFVPQEKPMSKGETEWERWILSKLQTTIEAVNNGFKFYDFAQATSAIYSFWLYDFCDNYLESLKPIIYGDANDASVAARQASGREVVYTCVDVGLRLLSPFMPFLTEELWHRIPRRPQDSTESICVAEFPQSVPAWADEEVERQVKFVQEAVSGVRRMRSSFQLTKQKPKLYYNTTSQEVEELLKKFTETLAFFTSCSEPEIVLNMKEVPEGCSVEMINENTQAYMTVKGMVNVEEEISKLEKKKEKTEGDRAKLLKTTQAAAYSKVPEAKKAENTAKLDSLQQEIDTMASTISNYKKFL
ncbi:hypothetical protein PROFUN_14080 [Planoprotostelium fungivorum]|uniref:Valine--tRNA ligase, mitochondrial n=1 Tax=Planoprotostelium fungivorum TaxID=1890364 RepID=A0A2P6N211_9EUKA|nr:hypothetical protein PROFUN_14080 [Planoprotostelium fungivorum]